MNIPIKRNYFMPDGEVTSPGKIYSIRKNDDSYLLTVYNTQFCNFWSTNMSKSSADIYVRGLQLSSVDDLVGQEIDCMYVDGVLKDFALKKQFLFGPTANHW